MEQNNKQLISFEDYSLSELFATPHRKIIIPDFQRDYCWGDEMHGKDKTNIVSGFLSTLFEEFDSNKEHDVLLGKIDIYEHPQNHIYLTDGQQRLTTLYLLIGMLFRKTKKIDLKNCLIAKYEESEDDKEPYLQYAIRESTVFFLRDSVNEFFIKGEVENVDDIKRQDWYFSEYDLDPTINSMLLALKAIEKTLDEERERIDNFAYFILYKVKILYNDVKDRSNGEERFVIINTTGRSLTVSENLKPILLASGIADKYCDEWEERETFFWKNRKENEQVADEGVNDFLTWCFQINNKHDEFDLIKAAKNLSKENVNLTLFLDKVQSLFEALIILESFLKDYKIQQQFKFINEDVVERIGGLRSLTKERKVIFLLPVLSFLSKFSDADPDEFYKFTRRVRKNYFDYLWEERKQNYIDWRYILQIIERAEKAEDCLTFKDSFISEKNVKLPDSYWFNEEEKIKIELAQSKEKLQQWEDHPDFMGDLSHLMEVTEKSKDISKWELYFNSYVYFVQANDPEIKNEVALITYCSKFDFFPRWFTLSGLGYICLEKNERNRIFRNNWFKLVWKSLAENENNRISTLRGITRNILFSILSSQEYQYSDEYWETIFNKNEIFPIKNEMFDAFEHHRVENWWFGDDCIIAAIFFWMYLEKEYDKNQYIGIKDGLNQIGFRRVEDNSKNNKSLSYANISFGSHYRSGKYLNYNYSLMKAVNEIQSTDLSNKIDKTKELLNIVKDKIVGDVQTRIK